MILYIFLFEITLPDLKFGGQNLQEMKKLQLFCFSTTTVAIVWIQTERHLIKQKGRIKARKLSVFHGSFNNLLSCCS